MFSWLKGNSKESNLYLDNYNNDYTQRIFSEMSFTVPFAISMEEYNDSDHYEDCENLNIYLPDGEVNVKVKPNSCSQPGYLLYYFIFSFKSLRSEGHSTVNIELEIPEEFHTEKNKTINISFASTDNVKKISDIDFNLTNIDTLAKSGAVISKLVSDEFTNALENSRLNFSFEDVVYEKNIIEISSQEDFDKLHSSGASYDEIILNFETLALSEDNHKISGDPTIRRKGDKSITINLIPSYGISSHDDLNKMNVFDGWIDVEFKNIKKLTCNSIVEFDVFEKDVFKDKWGDPSLDKNVRLIQSGEDSFAEERRLKKLYTPLEIERILRQEAEASVALIKETANIEIENLRDTMEELIKRHQNTLNAFKKHEFTINDHKDLCIISSVDVGLDSDTRELQRNAAIETLSILCAVNKEQFSELVEYLDHQFSLNHKISDIIAKVSSFTDINNFRRSSVIVDTISDINDELQAKLQPVSKIIESLSSIHENK